MKAIPYAISFMEWSDDIATMPRDQAGRLFKALLTATFEETDDLTSSIKQEQADLMEAFTAGTIELDEWTQKMRTLSELSCYWSQIKAAAEKTTASYKKRAAANSENGKKNAGKKKGKTTQTTPAQADPQPQAPRAIFNI